MTDAAFALNGMAGACALAGKVEPQADKMLLNGGSFYDYYRTRDGRYFSVGSLEPQFMARLFETIDKPQLAKLGLSPNADDQQLLKSTLKEAFAEHSFAHWQQVFADVEACVEPVLSVSEAACHPQLQARAMVVEVPTEQGDCQQQIGAPIKFSNHAPQYPHTGVALGAHTEEILADYGFDANAVETLRKCGALG